VSGKGWDDKKKVEVVTTYLALGKVPMVESVTGVPRATIRQWKLQPWWTELVSQIQEESSQELDTKLTRIIDKSLDTVNERIDNGEFILDSKTGTVKRVPVKLKDVHKVASDLLDKRDLVRGRPSQRGESTQTVDILVKLAQQFQSWVQKHEPRVIEGEVVAIHDQREEGLQEGVQQVPLQTQAEAQPRIKE
jgi:hypothetical protein